MGDFEITRCKQFPYLFNLKTSYAVFNGIDFETVQLILRVEPEDFARVDDGRFMLLV